MNTRLLFGLLWLTPTLCFGALSTTTSYFLNVEALTNVTARSAVSGLTGVFTNGITAGASTLTGNITAPNISLTNAILQAGPYDMVRIGNSSADSVTNDSQVAIGYFAGRVATNQTYGVSIGRHAGYQSHGANGVNIGHAAGQYGTNGAGAVRIGYLAGQFATNSANAVIIGPNAAGIARLSQNSVIIGQNAGQNPTSSQDTVTIGGNASAGPGLGTIDGTIAIGSSAGYFATNSGGSIFIGRRAGYYITSNNRLVIDSNIAYSTNNGALIYGEFDNRKLVFNGEIWTDTGTNATLAKIGGTLKVDTTTTGNVGGGTDNLISYTIPANVLLANGDAIEFDCAGTFAADAHLKTLTAVYGGTTLINSTSLAFNGLDWRVTGRIIRTGAATQKATATLQVGGTLLAALTTSITDYTTPAETLSGTVVFKCTGSDDDGTPADNAVVQQLMSLKWTPNGN